MELNDYQKAALATAIYPQEKKIIYPLIGLAGETGEVADKIKKEIRDRDSEFGTDSRREIAKEIGDVMWYLASLANDLGYTLDEIAKMNIEKIQSRRHRDKIHGDGDNR
jgi:NTP pyrophosphatase (non-canonical NTP hydrolase)